MTTRYYDLTLGSCSYNTPVVTETMIRSYYHTHCGYPSDVLIIENSTNEKTLPFLDRYKIPYIVNKGGTHSEGVDILIEKCKTKYLLLVDTDIVFTKDINPLYERFVKYKVTLMGEECSDRGDFKLKPRIHPWFCFINVDDIKESEIKFYDELRVKNTDSENFFKNNPCNDNNRFNEVEMYDVGSTFYEDIANAGYFISNVPSVNRFFIHYEGSSWQCNSGNKHFMNLGIAMKNEYRKEILFYKNRKLGVYHD